MEQRASATREANRIFRVGEVTSHSQAAKLEDWKLLHRRERHGKLHIVTVEGTKFNFPIPSAGPTLVPPPATTGDTGASDSAATGAAADESFKTEAESRYPDDPVAQARFMEAQRAGRRGRKKE
jgi:hypothetical protein